MSSINLYFLAVDVFQSNQQLGSGSAEHCNCTICNRKVSLKTTICPLSETLQELPILYSTCMIWFQHAANSQFSLLACSSSSSFPLGRNTLAISLHSSWLCEHAQAECVQHSIESEYVRMWGHIHLASGSLCTSQRIDNDRPSEIAQCVRNYPTVLTSWWQVYHQLLQHCNAEA